MISYLSTFFSGNTKNIVTNDNERAQSSSLSEVSQRSPRTIAWPAASTTSNFLQDSGASGPAYDEATKSIPSHGSPPDTLAPQADAKRVSPNTYARREEIRKTAKLDSLRGSGPISEPGDTIGASEPRREEEVYHFSDGAEKQDIGIDASQGGGEMSADVTARRISASEARARFLNTIESVSGIDNAYMEYLRRQQGGDEGISIDFIQTKLEELESARAELKKHQQDCQRCEREVIQAEHGGVQPVSDIIETEAASHESTSHFETIDLAPERKRYLSLVGDVDLLRERLTDMDIEYAQILHDKAMQDVIAQPLDSDLQKFLDNFEVERNLLAQRLKQAEDTELALKRAQSGADVRSLAQNDRDPTFQSDGPLSATRSLPGRDHYFDKSRNPGLSYGSWEYEASQKFLSSHELRRPAYKSVLNAHDGETVDKSDYIDAWLSDRAQTVSAKGTRLMDVQTQAGADPEPDEHKNQVFSHWPEDLGPQRYQDRQDDDRSHITSTEPNDDHEEFSRAPSADSLSGTPKKHPKPSQ